jgi:hypothetical protein
MLLGFSFFHVLFTLFGILIVLAPAILFGILFPDRAGQFHSRVLALASIWVGFMVTLLLSYFAPSLTLVMYAGPIAVSVGAIVMALAFLRRQAPSR